MGMLILMVIKCLPFNFRENIDFEDASLPHDRFNTIQEFLEGIVLVCCSWQSKITNFST